MKFECHFQFFFLFFIFYVSVCVWDLFMKGEILNFLIYLIVKLLSIKKLDFFC